MNNSNRISKANNIMVALSIALVAISAVVFAIVVPIKYAKATPKVQYFDSKKKYEIIEVNEIQGHDWIIKTVKDTQTGVVYEIVVTGDSASMCPVYNADGTLKVIKTQE